MHGRPLTGTEDAGRLSHNPPFLPHKTNRIKTDLTFALCVFFLFTKPYEKSRQYRFFLFRIQSNQQMSFSFRGKFFVVASQITDRSSRTVDQSSVSGNSGRPRRYSDVLYEVTMNPYDMATTTTTTRIRSTIDAGTLSETRRGNRPITRGAGRFFAVVGDRVVRRTNGMCERRLSSTGVGSMGTFRSVQDGFTSGAPPKGNIVHSVWGKTDFPQSVYGIFRFFSNRNRGGGGNNNGFNDPLFSTLISGCGRLPKKQKTIALLISRAYTVPTKSNRSRDDCS